MSGDFTFRITRPQAYPIGSKGHTDLKMRQGHYFDCATVEEALVLMSAEFPTDGMFDVQRILADDALSEATAHKVTARHVATRRLRGPAPRPAGLLPTRTEITITVLHQLVGDHGPGNVREDLRRTVNAAIGRGLLVTGAGDLIDSHIEIVTVDHKADGLGGLP